MEELALAPSKNAKSGGKNFSRIFRTTQVSLLSSATTPKYPSKVIRLFWFGQKSQNNVYQVPI